MQKLERKRRRRNSLALLSSCFPILASITSGSWAFHLPVSLFYTGHPLFLSFISSQTEDWGYLNEDGELGLAYQGLKQVARSNVLLSSHVRFVRLPAHVYAPCVSAR